MERVRGIIPLCSNEKRDDSLLFNYFLNFFSFVLLHVVLIVIFFI